MRALCFIGFVLFTLPTLGDEKTPGNRLEFTRMIAHWANYGDPAYLDFVKEAQPELVQLGFYGGHFWSLAHTPQYKGYPAHFPVQGLNPCGDWFEEKNRRLHQMGVKVVGHFNVEFLVGEPDGPEGPRGFFDFYQNQWDEKELGPKPVKDPTEFLEKGADGKPIIQHAYKIGGMPEYWACLRNPAWQKVLKAWIKRGIERGLDGFIANYFYRHNCLCEHCQNGFKSHLKDHFTPAELREKFEIADLKTHQFEELVSWHKAEESTPLKREMLRWSQISNKKVFDEVFLKYGRSLKPDLIAAQWNHLGDFNQISGDERCLLPNELWGRGEDYLWYSAGGSACATDLKTGDLGDVMLQARYIRGAFDDKPFTIGKYEQTRIRSAIAELAANGGAPMGFYTRFTDPAAREIITRYYQFIKQHDAVFRGNASHAEVLLLYPRKAVHAGDVDAVKSFKEVGRQLLERHVLFDVVPDDLATKSLRNKYDRVFDLRPGPPSFGGLDLSRFEVPKTVRVSASRPAEGNQLDLHFVNYNREEPPPGRNGQPNPGRGIQDEKPISAGEIKCDVRLPVGKTASRLELLTPEVSESRDLKFQQKERRLKFSVPEFLVYGIVRIHFEP